MKYQINGVGLNVHDQGDGEPVLIFLHYWGGSSRTWREVINAWRQIFVAWLMIIVAGAIRINQPAAIAWQILRMMLRH
jgi:pimeloyl-ACP methyl ester carboxylesterase